MKVQRVIKSTTDIELQITGITLLSFDEYKELKETIPNCYSNWWLRTPARCSSHAGYDKMIFSSVMYVCADGYAAGAVDTGTPPRDDEICVRPALLLSATDKSGMQIGDVINVANTEWTIVSDSMAISTIPIGLYCFHADIDNYPTSYEESDIKKFLDRWAEDNGIVFDKA